MFLSTVDQRKNRKERAGPFCSRKCSGLYSANIQNNKMEKINRTEIIRTYYTKKFGIENIIKIK
jgi:hypothetical protein